MRHDGSSRGDEKGRGNREYGTLDIVYSYALGKVGGTKIKKGGDKV